ncbi:hypothetical protein SDC9_206039 [bioreactor metagenome]|uniref:Uncharacterized protein n=1 Tax=bioreactor metagenome TaxID=1076179 RepID=A0A645J3P1_9ZZZZ
MTPDVIPVNMGCHGGNRLVGQLYNFIKNVADSKSSVN